MKAQAPGPIYVDVDDVLADATETLIGLARDMFAVEVSYPDLKSFDLGESFGLSEFERDQLLEAAHRSAVIESMTAIEGASEVLGDWWERGFEIAIVTGRPPSTLQATARWLDRAGIPHTRLLSIDKYGRQKAVSGATALESLRGSRFAFAIEDALTMARFLVEEVATPVLLFDRPWNRDVDTLALQTRARILRVGSWSEIAAQVDEAGALRGFPSLR